MTIEFEVNMNIKIMDNYHEFIQSEKYEKELLPIINHSFVIPGNYRRVDIQSSGEPDYIENETRRKMDIKLLITDPIGYSIAKADYEMFSKELTKLLWADFDKNIINSELYKVMLTTLKKICSDEDGIIFIPFPIDLNFSESLVVNYSNNMFSYIFDEIYKNETGVINTNNNYYLIYLTFDDELAIRCLHRGYSHCTETANSQGDLQYLKNTSEYHFYCCY